MLANSMPSAAAQAMRACGRSLPAVKFLAATSAASRALLSRHSFLITPGYKARIAVRGYATATATKTKSPTAAAAKRKPAAKKAPVKAKAKAKATKKPVKAKAKPKKKAVAKPKKPVKKVKAKKQPTVAELKRDLKRVALYHNEPTQLPTSTWTVYNTESYANGNAGASGTPFGDRIKSIAAGYKNISASEKSRLEQKARENAAINAINYKKWVESHTIQDIAAANNARLMYRRKYAGAKEKRLPRIVDQRVPSRPANAFCQFVKSQMTGVSEVTTGVKDIAARWKSLSDADKKPYTDLAHADLAKYQKTREALGLSK